MNSGLKRIAVVGLGNRAHSWVSAIVEKYPHCAELSGLCDTDVNRCSSANNLYRTKADVYDDYDSMLAEIKPDKVIVTSPDNCHGEHIIKALAAGCGVATEKPLCTSIEEADAILKAEKSSRIKIFMAFNYRHVPLCRETKKILKSGIIGNPVSIDLSWYLNYRGHGASYFRRWHRLMKNSGGLLITKGSHHLDMANWLMDDLPASVSAYGSLNFFGKGKNPYSGKRCSSCGHAGKCEWYTDVCSKDRSEDLSRELGYTVQKVPGYIRDYCPFAEEIDIYDTMSVIVRYKNGGQLNYSLNSSVPFEGWNLAVNCTHGRLETGITDNKPLPGWQGKYEIKGPDGETLKGKGYSVTDWPAEYPIHVIPHDGDDRLVKVPSIKEGHGGGDKIIMDAAFAGVRPEADDVGAFADGFAGAVSTAVGHAANISIESGNSFALSEVIDGWLKLRN